MDAITTLSSPEAATAAAPWPPTPWDILHTPLPALGAADGWLMRAVALLARRQVIAIRGLEHVTPARDPFILAINHSTRTESIFVPTLVMLHRYGRLVHFVADWNYRPIPGIGLLYRRSQIVTVTNKPARPRALNFLKSLYRYPDSALERARAHLHAGHSIGIFPEGRINRDPQRMLPGRRGAARLSLETGIPIVPAGIRFPDNGAGRPISDGAIMAVEIGRPLMPPPLASPTAPLNAVRAWHAVVMTEIGRLAGKAWTASREEIADGAR